MTDFLNPAESSSEPLPRLGALARHGRQAETRTRGLSMSSWTDDLSHLSEQRRVSWRRILSSIATTEGLEATIMEPLLAAKKRDPEVLDYLEVHAADERRHEELFKSYLKNAFDFEKRERTFSDRVFYDRILPAISQSFRYRPLYGFALLYCYERFSLLFYGPLRAKAQADGAQNLLNLVQSVEKDELRHVAGMEQLLKEEIRRLGGLRWFDLAAVRAMLEIMLVDINLEAWAIHNRELRGHFLSLGIDPDKLTADGRRMRDETVALMAVAAKGVKDAAAR